MYIRFGERTLGEGIKYEGLQIGVVARVGSWFLIHLRFEQKCRAHMSAIKHITPDKWKI